MPPWGRDSPQTAAAADEDGVPDGDEFLGGEGAVKGEVDVAVIGGGSFVDAVASDGGDDV